MLVIDGQQRLQSFYMGLKGGVNGKQLYFNLFSQDDYEFEFARQISDLPLTRNEDGVESATLWFPVSMLYTQLSRNSDDRQAAREIIRNQNIPDEQHKDLVYYNVGNFQHAIFTQRAIGMSRVYINIDNPDMERRRMVELFRRLNDGGTRLSALDLAASTLKGFDYRLEAFLRRDVPRYQDIGFGQDEVVKLLFLLQDNYVKEVTDIGKEDADFAIAKAARILKTLDVLRQLLKDAGLYEYFRGGGRSVIPLYFVAYHIFHKPESDAALSGLYRNFDANNPDFTNIKCWLYLSLLNGVFSRGRGWIPYRTGIHKILNVVRQYKGNLFPPDAIFSMYEAYPLDFSRELSEKMLPRWDRNFVFYLIYDWRTMAGRDVDHIQPKSLLTSRQVPAEKIHTVANFQLLDEDTNRAGKRAKELKEWLKDWDAAERDPYLARHLIPQQPELWGLDRFDDLLLERSKKIVEKIRQAIPQHTIPSKPAPPQPAPSPEPGVSPINVGATRTGAAQLTRKERDPEAWLKGVAEQKGMGKEFCQIVDAARELGLYARFQNNWWVVMFTPSKNRSKSLIELGTSLTVYVSHDRIAQYLNCPVEVVKEKFINRRENIQPSDVTRWIENLRSLFSTK
jgi:hypothetical protein